MAAGCFFYFDHRRGALVLAGLQLRPLFWCPRVGCVSRISFVNRFYFRRLVTFQTLAERTF